MSDLSPSPCPFRPVRRLPAGLAALALVFLQACSGGGGGTTSATVSQPPPAASPDLAGAWVYTAASGTVYRDLILPGTFEFRSLDSNMAEGVGTMTVNGNVLGGTITAYPPAAYSPYYPILTGTVSGTATDTAINDTVTFSLGTASANLVPDTPANVAVQLAELAGTYAADPLHTSSGVAGTLTVNSDGTFTLTDANSSGQGALTQVAANRNAFRVTLAVTPAGGSPTDYTGLCYLLPGTPASIVLMTSRSSGQVSGIFARQ